MYNYDVSDLNQMLTNIEIDYIDKNKFNIELLILKRPSDDHPKLNRILYFEYFVDEKGFVDDIKFIRDEVFREDDGTPIIRPNSRKFDEPQYYANYFINMVYGYNFFDYRANILGYGENIEYNDEILWELKEYALTENLKGKYDLYEGLLPDELKQKAYIDFEDIVVSYKENYFSYHRDFPKEKEFTVPIVLNFNHKQYNYNLSYSITDDNYLDSISLEEKNNSIVVENSNLEKSV